MTRDKYRKAWLRSQKVYERKAFNILRKYFRQEALKVPYEFLNEENYEGSVDAAIKIGGLYNAYYDIYNVIGTLHGERIGKGLNRDIKDFSSIIFKSEWQRNLFNWILENVGFRIISVRQEFVKYIRQLVAQSFIDGVTTRELSAQIHKLIARRDFYRWQALRIARTESTNAANSSALVAGDSSGLVYDKIWISGQDSRVRQFPDDNFDHREMDGQIVAKNDYFETRGFIDNAPIKEYLLHPGADTVRGGGKSSAGNVINCRCTTALMVRRDSNGRIIRV